jgi:hypothetical protein
VLSFSKKTLEQLFDFSKVTQIDITSRTPLKSLDEELELYELVIWMPRGMMMGR